MQISRDRSEGTQASSLWGRRASCPPMASLGGGAHMQAGSPHSPRAGSLYFAVRSLCFLHGGLGVLTRAVLALSLAVTAWAADAPLALGDRRELFVDRYLIDALEGARLRLHEPRDEGTTIPFDQPWEGQFCGYATVLRDSNPFAGHDNFRAYYRGKPEGVSDGKSESTLR